jgi:23S rRNA pseudouridine1911/1915/1917 synthase
LSFAVLYEDEDLLAVAKPAGLPTLPGANFLNNTLLHLVRAYAPDATPLHRLGRWTSGLVLCARNHHSRNELMRQWSVSRVDKRYRALASGLPYWNEMTVDAPIGPVPHALLGSVHAAAPQGKHSLSRVSVLERRTDSFLCDVRIMTGRPHQIRIHMAAVGHPLVGDPLYAAGGLPAPDTHALPGDPGYHLHAAELKFLHPGTGRELLIECEPPEILRVSSSSY